MRPDPWQREKSRKYQAKRKAKGLETKNVDEKKDAKPVHVPPKQERNFDVEVEADGPSYDVAVISDGVDYLEEFKSVTIQQQNMEVYLRPEDCKELEERISGSIDPEGMPFWLPNDFSVSASTVGVKIQKPPVRSETCGPTLGVSRQIGQVRERRNSLEDLLDDILDKEV